ncbi:sensor histidine kinase, partial [Escherichia coli]|uniref:sensor histidine kinase n=1 Tax=Escherichia coli TaxID=562 RepID=UPI001125A890
GVGIADEEKGKIFSPYYRPELAWKIDSAGHGLGLAVVARCAKLVEVWDTGVGIADEEKGKIFSPYYRPELAWKIDSAGHGLG